MEAGGFEPPAGDCANCLIHKHLLTKSFVGKAFTYSNRYSCVLTVHQVLSLQILPYYSRVRSIDCSLELAGLARA